MKRLLTLLLGCYLGTILILLSVLWLISCEKNNYIGEVSEGDPFTHVALILPTTYLDVGDTLFFIIKNDSVISVQTNNGEHYMRRYKFYDFKVEDEK